MSSLPVVQSYGVYECSGLRVLSAIPLAAPLLVGIDHSAVDLTIVLGEPRTPPFERPSADVVAELIIDGYPRYLIGRVGQGYVCRVVNVGDFIIDADLSRVVCHPTIEGRGDVVPILLAGTVIAFVLAMRGQCVLHGSAVQIRGGALAFIGVSGQGKSTMAALFCAAGALLVTDDVLAVVFESDESGNESVLCLRSGSEIRLRSKARSLVDRFDERAPVRVTVDDRHAIGPPGSDLDRLPLDAIILPRPDRGRRGATARLVPFGEASFKLACCERIEGWQAARSLSATIPRCGTDRLVGSSV